MKWKRICLILLLGLSWASSMQGQAHVLVSHTSPNGLFKVSVADYSKPFRYELWSELIPTGVRVKIGKNTPDSEDVVAYFVISNDSQRVLYIQQNTALGIHRDLNSTGIYAQSSIVVSQPMVQGGGVEPNFTLVKNEDKVRYLADPYVDEQYRWFRVAVTGGRVYEEVFIDGFESGNTSSW